MQSTIRLVLADHQVLMREGMRALLRTEQGFEVVGETGDGLTAAEMVEELRPEALIIDDMMPGLGGADVARRVTRRTHSRVIILSAEATEHRVYRALRGGAHAYVLRSAGRNDLVQAIREAVVDRFFLSSPLSHNAIKAYIHARETSGETDDPWQLLTLREREILHLASEGQSNARIAERLSISVRTVETHRARAQQKLGLHSLSDLVQFAIREGIIPGGGFNQGQFPDVRPS